MQVTDIWRYPVKSLGGERLTTATIGPHGISGDRAWGLVDCETGMVLTARREPRLLMASAALIDDDVCITLPVGSIATDDSALSTWLGKDVELRRAGEGIRGTYENPLDWEGEADWASWEGPDGSFHDSGRTTVSLCGEGTTGSWDRRRFRQNIWVTGSSEAEYVGRAITIGSTQLSVLKPISRCVMVTRPQPGIDRDLSVLKTINNEMAGHLGVGATVSSAGLVSVGDEVQLAAGTTST